MKMNDNTILRIKVPAHLYEAVKAQLTLKEAKGGKVYGAGMEEVKGQKTKGATSDKPKASAPKKPAAHKNANASVKVTPYNAVKADKETSKMGAGVSEAKKMGLEELKKLAELLNNEITKLEEKSHDKEDKEKVEEARDMDAIQARVAKTQPKSGIVMNLVKDALKNNKKVEADGQQITQVTHVGLWDGEKNIIPHKVETLTIDGEDQNIDDLVAQATKEPEVQYISQPSKPQWDFTTGPMGGGKLD